MKTTKKTITIEQALKASNSSSNQSIKQKFVGREVYCNVGTLCEYVLNSNASDAPFTIDDIENLYSYPEYYGDHANFGGGTEDQRNEEIERLKEKLEDLETKYKDARLEEKQDEINNEIQELENLETEPSEIFEWWAVSSYLYDKLKELGYCVVDAGSCKVWGRCTSGQAILLDYAISKICADMEILEGQANSWA